MAVLAQAASPLTAHLISRHILDEHGATLLRASLFDAQRIMADDLMMSLQLLLLLLLVQTVVIGVFFAVNARDHKTYYLAVLQRASAKASKDGLDKYVILALFAVPALLMSVDLIFGGYIMGHFERRPGYIPHRREGSNGAEALLFLGIFWSITVTMIAAWLAVRLTPGGNASQDEPTVSRG